MQTFPQCINWFKLKISEGQVFKILTNSPEEKPAEYFIEHRGEYYSLEAARGYEPVQPETSLLRRIILQGFKSALEKKNFEFKGSHLDIAYYYKKEFPQPHKDIFSLYTASFEFRVASYFTGEQDEFYLVINPHLAFTFNADIEYLDAQGVPKSKLANHSVRVLLEADDGRVSGIDGFLLETYQDPEKGLLCRVLHAREGSEESFAAKQVYLESRPEIINSILKDIGSKYDVINLQRDQSFLKSQSASMDRLDKTKKIVKFLLEEAKVFPLTVGNFIINLFPEPLAVGGSGFPRIGKIPEPTLLFDRSDSSATHFQPYWGLRTFGPFTKDLSVIKVALLGPKSGIQQLETMVQQMNRGTSIMPDGVRRFFYTKLEIVDTEIVPDESINSYVQGAEKLAAKSERSKPDVALVHINKTSDFDLETPYYNVKPVLLKHNLPSQMVTPKSLANAQWIHGNIGNAIFAKAHGYPWVLAQDIPEFDMIMGVALSQAISKTKRAGARPRYLSYANVFDELGRWMFFESTPLVYESATHEEQLTKLVETSIDKYQTRKDQTPKTIAIHYYKRFGRKEREKVLSMLDEKLGDYRVAFIAIDKSHPMRLYDLSNREGSFRRAHYAQLSETEFLLCTTGITELGKKRLGTPLILKVTFDQYPETFVSVENIASQILALTRLNYKTLTPIVGEPVTLHFANLVANFMAAFSEVQWEAAQEIPKSRLHTVPWFL